MAKVVEDARLEGVNRGRKAIYPWDDWTNGQTWEAFQGEDFVCDAGQFRTNLYDRARRHGMKVVTSVVKAPAGSPPGTFGGGILFRFYDEVEETNEGWNDDRTSGNS